MSTTAKVAANIGLIVLIVIIAAIDFYSGGSPRLRVPLFIPIGIGAYLFGLRYGLLLTFMAGIADVAISLLLGREITSSLISAVLFRLGTFALMVLLIDRLTTQLKIIRQLESRRDAELERAREIQSSVLTPVPSRVGSSAIAAKLTFAREVGGDYYYVSPCDGRVLIAIGDISGKSVSAAMFSVLLHHSLLDILSNSVDPAEILLSLNRRLSPVLPDDMFITLFLGLIDSSTITFVNAGHEPPFHYRSSLGSTKLIRQNRALPIGIGPEIQAANLKEPFGPGDILLTVTDGVTESRALGNDPVGTITAVLTENHKKTAGDIVDIIHRLAAPDPMNQRDDVTVLCLKNNSARP